MALYSLRKFTIGGTGGGDVTYPWDLTLSESGGVTTVNIRPGSINNVVPSNMFEPYPATSSDTLFVKLACSTDGSVITDVVLYINGNPSIAQTPVNSALPSYFEHTVGIIHEGQGFNIARKFLTAVGSRLFLTDRPAPAEPGQKAYEEWLVWSIS
jgi:hypothetical protein